MEIKRGFINVSVANLYMEGTYHSEIVSQALLGEKVLIKRVEKDFSLIEMSDGYGGWISNHQWVIKDIIENDTLMIRSHFAAVYSDSSVDSMKIRDATLGTILHVGDRRDGWIQVKLPDGKRGWVEERIFGSFPSCSREAAIDLAKEFLGYPYFWGGRSPKGFDCSGLTQRIFCLLGVSLPRDAWMQHRDGAFITDKPGEAKPGDLYFFAENSSKITHVGLAIGKSRMIHARGYVRSNSLQPGDEDYSPELKATFIDVRSYF